MNKQKKREGTLLEKTFVLFFMSLLIWPYLASAGDLEPTDLPGPTMHTLEQIYQKPVWKIKGLDFMTWPQNSRFKVSYDGYVGPGLPNWGSVVIDKETGLMWARDANIFQTSGRDPDGLLNWENALGCMQLSIANRKGWRLPVTAELSSLLDMSRPGQPRLPEGHPFLNVQSSWYWTISTHLIYTDHAWVVNIAHGDVNFQSKSNSYHVWPVRGGK